MRPVAIIPARGGSRRIPGKNKRLFHGKPIIAYSIETAIASRLFDHVFVSTDDDEIADIAEQYGAQTIIRPAHMCEDSVGTQDVMRFVLSEVILPKVGDFNEACCIYPTAPMVSVDDLKRGYSALYYRATAYAFSVGTEPLRDAGQFYWGYVESFTSGIKLISEDSTMVPIDECRVCDINTEEDWQRAERMYAKLCGL